LISHLAVRAEDEGHINQSVLDRSYLWKQSQMCRDLHPGFESFHVTGAIGRRVGVVVYVQNALG